MRTIKVRNSALLCVLANAFVTTKLWVGEISNFFTSLFLFATPEELLRNAAELWNSGGFMVLVIL